VVPRLRLYARLEEGMRCPLTLISAPAGFGKTTLLGAWLQHYLHPVAWISLDHCDNDLVRFWEYCLAAIARALPSLDEQIDLLVQAIRPNGNVEAILTPLLNMLAACDQELLLVLDDYQVINAPSIQQTLAFFIEHIPSCVHVLISTRVDPSLPLARWRVQGKLFELRSDDLRFSLEETITLFCEGLHLPLKREDLRTLVSNTEGWIAGLQLAALSLQGRADPEEAAHFISAFSGTNRYVLNYLTEEVLANLPEEVQNFLLMTSILRCLNADLCNALTGQQNGAQMLEWLEQANIFISQVDEQGSWYRYHHLFADLLHYRLRQQRSASIAELHRRASHWFTQHKMILDATEHAVAAGDLDTVANLLERHAWTFYLQGHSTQLFEWLEPLQGRVDLTHHPIVAYFIALACLYTGDQQYYLEALRCMQQMCQEEQFTQIDGSAGYHLNMSNVQDLVAYAALFYGNGEQALTHTQESLLLSPESSERCVTHLYQGGAYLQLGDTHQALRELLLSRHLAARSQHVYAQQASALYLGDVAREQGRLVEAANWYRACIQGAGEHMHWHQMQACFRLGTIYFEWNELASAEDMLHQALSFKTGYGQEWVITDGNLLAAQIAWLQRKSDQASVLLDRAEADALRQRGHPFNMARIALFRVRSWLDEGNIEETVSWVKSARALRAAQEQREQVLECELWCLIDARLALAQQHPEKVVGILQPLLTTVHAQERSHNELLLLVTLVQAYTLSGDTRRARHALESVLSLAERGKYRRLLLDEGEVLLSLFADLYQRQQKRFTGEFQPHTLEYVYALLQDSGYSTVPHDWTTWQQRGHRTKSTINHLSERELEVLKLIAEGHSNQQIAHTLVVAESTIKTHLNNIYGKLNVNSRLQALTKAHSSGLLEF
ncbi:MAG: AAA family ATPase, partial [Chloroflexi bacterium]|nr:AAA family ATPase [Chloroflexota bacterium]